MVMTPDHHFYLRKGKTVYAVTDCDCCCVDGFQDAWEITGKGGVGECHSFGIRRRAIHDLGKPISAATFCKLVPEMAKYLGLIE